MDQGDRGRVLSARPYGIPRASLHPHRRRDGRGMASRRGIVPIQRDPVLQKTRNGCSSAASTDAEVTSAQQSAVHGVYAADQEALRISGRKWGTAVSAHTPDRARMPNGSTAGCFPSPATANADGGGEHQAHHGIYDASLGARSMKPTGKAILAPQRGRVATSIHAVLHGQAITHRLHPRGHVGAF